MAQLVELCFLHQRSAVRIKSSANVYMVHLFTYCELCWKDGNNEKEAGNGRLKMIKDKANESGIQQILTNCRASSVLSPLGSGLSMASTTQLAMMVSRTVYSKGGHSMRNFVSRRIRFDSRRMKSEVGPSFFSSSFFFFPIVGSICTFTWNGVETNLFSISNCSQCDQKKIAKCL